MALGKAEMLYMFSKFGYNKTIFMIQGIITLLSVVLIAFSTTHDYGNVLMAGVILLILCFQLF